MGGLKLKMLTHPEGYIEPNNSGGYDYVYQYKDHLGNIRLSYADIQGNYQSILNSDFETTLDGWEHNGSVTTTLVNGQLKVGVNSSWEGVKHHLNNLEVNPGETFKVSITFDKGTVASNIRFYIQELDANGNHLSWNGLNYNLQSGTSNFNYTVNEGKKLILRLDKDNINTINDNYFYIDHISFSKGQLEIIEENNYYPFGLQHKGYGPPVSAFTNAVASKFKYNGKEYEEALGLNLYEMDVRMYDPTLARFNGIDPVTHHSQGTSVAFDNNPIYWADPSGADADPFWDNRHNIDDGFGGAMFAEGQGFIIGQIASRSGGVGGGSNSFSGMGGLSPDTGNYEQLLLDDVEWLSYLSDPEVTHLPEVQVKYNDIDSYKNAASEIVNSIYSTDWYKTTYLIAGIYGAGREELSQNKRLERLVNKVGGTMFRSNWGGGDKKIIEYLTSVDKGNVYISILGYSRGGNAAIRITNELGRMGIQVSNLYTFDPHALSHARFNFRLEYDNVTFARNFFQRNSEFMGQKGNPFRGRGLLSSHPNIDILNYDFTGVKGVTHLNIVDYVLKRIE